MDDTKNHSFDYMHLLDRFDTSVAENLRSTGFSEPYLSLWVPDPNPVRSLTGFIHSVCQETDNTVELILPRSLLSDGDRAILAKATVQEAKLKWRDTPEKTTLTMAALRTSTPVPDDAGSSGFLRDMAHDTAPALSRTVSDMNLNKSVLPEAWRAYLADQAQNPSEVFEDYQCAGWISYRTQRCWLAVKKDSDGSIVETVYGVTGENVLLDGLLRVLGTVSIGKPPSEMAFHGLLHVIECCKSQRPDAALPGIIVPVSLGSEFADVTQLLALFRANGTETYHKFDEAPAKTWLMQDDSLRKQALTDAIESFVQKEKLVSSDVMLLDVRVDMSGWANRVFIQCSERIPTEKRPDLLRRLERFLKDTVERKLVVLYETAKDANRIRRL